MPEPTIGSMVATKVFADIFSAFAKSVLSSAGQKFHDLLSHKNSSLRAHIEATFERCTKIKTLLNRDEPADLLAQYVNLNFVHNRKKFDDYDLIDQLGKRRRIVISGTGGGGKTVFMKYLWIALFENPKGRIPLFVELRRLNEQENDRLDLYIYHSIVDTQSTLPQSEFEDGIKSGRFVLILDGFDELDEKKREIVEKQILALAHNNPGLTVVVSSRGDERFAAWQSFSIFHVQPLTKQQVTELIQKLTYDRIIKKKFIERIRKDLYERHTSFLSNPLLATMMLLTFDQFADIPEKIHLFYEQAFDTLFAKHDATKEAYKRHMYTNLSIDTFKRIFAYFCLATYYDEKFEFNETDCLSYIRKAIAIENSGIEPARYLKDLSESVCMLQKDGMQFVFSHRSFQEFFAAYCLARVSSSHFARIITKIGRRPSDKVIRMLYDMDGALLEREFILPRLRHIVSDISRFSNDEFLLEYCAYLDADIKINKEEKELGFSHSRSGDRDAFIQTLRELYKTMDPKATFFEECQKIDNRILSKYVPKKFRGDPRLLGTIKIVPGKSMVEWYLESEGEKRVSVQRAPAPWFTETGYATWCRREADWLKSSLAEIEKQQGTKSLAFDKLLGLGQLPSQEK